ncbi:SDR family NAD(P)-dependent oxidoreductase [Amycolatopsis sp. NPDC023774]|uniref:SDR family NAD(P)-dependent oxidoreductase n=1 Tax=Amycolatopsis sp. NPDC023774 TaxID=3155015 RepID=UPI0033C5D420
MSEPKTIVITGASDGIGAAAAPRLHADGHRVVVVGRSPAKTEAVAGELGVEHHTADFARFADVRRLAAALDATHPRIDVLVNNAGGIFGDRAKTTDGFEKTLQVNHLSPFLLTTLLMDKLLASRASLIQTSSSGARLFGDLRLDDLDHDAAFTAHKAYGTAKLSNILFTRELHARFHARGLSAAAFHPGVVTTAFATESASFFSLIYKNPLGRMAMVSPEKGARQLVWLATTAPGVEWESGVYYERGKPARRVNPRANDDELARRLWDRSAELVGVKTA